MKLKVRFTLSRKTLHWLFKSHFDPNTSSEGANSGAHRLKQRLVTCLVTHLNLSLPLVKVSWLWVTVTAIDLAKFAVYNKCIHNTSEAQTSTLEILTIYNILEKLFLSIYKHFYFFSRMLEDILNAGESDGIYLRFTRRGTPPPNIYDWMKNLLPIAPARAHFRNGESFSSFSFFFGRWFSFFLQLYSFCVRKGK